MLIKMVNPKHPFLLPLILIHCVYVVQYSVSVEPDDQRDYYGPYDHIYPFVDITQDQLNCSTTDNGTCPLYIALLVSFGGEFDSSGVVPGVQMALDQINSDPNILPGYTLHYTLKATKVSNSKLSMTLLFLCLCVCLFPSLSLSPSLSLFLSLSLSLSHICSLTHTIPFLLIFEALYNLLLTLPSYKTTHTHTHTHTHKHTHTHTHTPSVKHME